MSDSDRYSDTSSWVVTVVAVVLLLIVAAVAGVVVLDRPRVESVDNDWGTVTENRTEIETQIAIDNPRLLRLGDSVLNLEYTVSLNDVRVAHGRKRTVDLSGGRNATVNVTTFANNDAVPEWWVSHVNRNETTTVRVQPDVIVSPVGLSLPMRERTRTRTFSTDMLAPLRTTETRRFQLFDRTLLIVNGTHAHWGNATAAHTPLVVSATVTNPTPVSIPLVDIGYTVHMNGIQVGHSTGNQRQTIPPHSTRTIETRAVIDNSKLDQWWVTHLRRNETTHLRVDFYATIDLFGQRERVPLDFLSYERTFHTQIFEPDGSTANRSATIDAPTTEGDSARLPVRTMR